MPWSKPKPPRWRRRKFLNGVQPAFPGADANRLLHVGDEDLSVTDATGLGRIADGLDGAVDQLVRQDDLDLHLGKKVDNVFGPAVELGVTLLAPEALCLGYCDALEPHFLQRLFHLIELEWFDDGFDLLHSRRTSRGWPRRSEARSMPRRVRARTNRS